MMAGKKNIHRGDAETLRKEKTNAKPESAEVAENAEMQGFRFSPSLAASG
jgi:hypothetical protein